MPNIVVLTGAGISAESGIRTFRDGGGLWENHRIEDVATPEGFHRNPRLVYEFYNQRRRQLKDPNLKPNAAHLALAELEARWTGEFLLVTQNVDDLHQRAGSKKLISLHGELRKARCTGCHQVVEWDGDLDESHDCAQCGYLGQLRPHIVWFGEMPLSMGRIGMALENADYFLAVGTSGQVYPAAGFVASVPEHCKKTEINLNPTDISNAFDEHLTGPASEQLPRWAKALLETITKIKTD